MGKSALVVGGGIAGLFASQLLVRKGYAVSLVDVAPKFGGLFQSTQFGDGVLFDHGIHYAIETGSSEIDNILLGPISPADWHVFEGSLPEGHVFRGALQTYTGCIDARHLDRSDYVHGLGELLTASQPFDGAKTLKQELVGTFGQVFTERIFRGAMKKLTGQELEELAPGLHKQFHIPRIVVLPSDASRALKTLPSFDSRIAFARFTDGTSDIRKFYPKRKGIGAWPDGLVEDLAQRGASLRPGVSVSKAASDGTSITSVTLSDGSQANADLVVWTAPMALLKRAMGETPPKPPKFRHVLLLHFMVEGTLVDRCHWVSVYDEDLTSYRITLYRNICPELAYPGGDRVTVEVLVDDPDTLACPLADIVADELIALECVSGRVQMVGSQMVKNAFPVAMCGSSETQMKQPELSNLVLGGRDSSGGPYQFGVLRGIYSELSDRV